jgi:hypothetical protein
MRGQMAPTKDELSDIVIPLDVPRSKLNIAKRGLQTFSQRQGNGAHVGYHRDEGNNKVTGISIKGTNLTKKSIAGVVNSLINGSGEINEDDVKQTPHESPDDCPIKDPTEGLDMAKAEDWQRLKAKVLESEGRYRNLQDRLTFAEGEVADSNAMLQELFEENARGVRVVTAVAAKLGIAKPAINVFTDDAKTDDYGSSLCDTVDALKERSQGGRPDLEAEFIDMHIGYLFGLSDNEIRKRDLVGILDKNGVERKRTGTGRSVIRTYGSLVEKLDGVLTDMGVKTKPERCAMEARIKSYFTAEKNEEWSRELWDDEKEVDVTAVALAYRAARNTVNNLIKKAGIEHKGKEGHKFIYRWGDIKELMEKVGKSQLRAPQPVGAAGVRPLTEDEVWEFAQEESDGRKRAEDELEAVKAKLAEFETQIKEGGGTPLYRTSEEHLIRAFIGIAQPSMEEAISNYSRIFPSRMPDTVRNALLPLGDFIYKEIGDAFDSIPRAFSEEGFNVDGAKEALKLFDVDFSETSYARENKDLYDISKENEPNWRFKASLSAEEETEKEVIEGYERAERDHDGKRRAAKVLLDRIAELEENHRQCTEETEEFRSKNLPLNALITTYAYTFTEPEGSDEKYVLRFVLPTTEENLKEDLSLTFTFNLSGAFKGRNADVRAGEILGCKYIDLVYNEDVRDRAQSIVDETGEVLGHSDLANAGAKINIKYIGEVPKHDRG